MSPSNPSAHTHASWLSQKPVNYCVPNNPVELVRVKVTQFNAVVNRLASQSSVRVSVDYAGLTQLLAKHLKQNPAATDPFNINFRIDPANGDVVLQHFDLEYRIAQTDHAPADKVNGAPVDDLHTERFRKVMNQIVTQGFNSVDEKIGVLAACDVDMRPDSALAGFNLATRTAKADLLPTPEKLDESMKHVAGNIPDAKRHIARQLLARLVGHLIEPTSRQIAQGQAVDTLALRKIAETALVFLRTLNTASPLDPIITHTDLDTDQLAHLATVFVAAWGVFQNDHLRLREIEQFVSHVHLKASNIATVRLNGDLFEHLPLHVQADRDVVMAAVQTNSAMLEFASLDLRGDREVVLAAVRQNGSVLMFASDSCLNDREVVLNAVQQFGLSLEFASNEVRNDREVVMAAVLQDGIALESASVSLQGDRDVLLAAVKQNGMALEFGSEELRNDREVVMVAVQNDGLALELASEALRNDREVVKTAICSDNSSDEVFGIEAYALEFASDELRDDLELVMTAVQKDGWALQVASPRLRANREVVMAAVLQDPDAIDFASDELKEDVELLFAAGLS